ncbi:hypothetical protein JDFR1000234_51 [uncultured archaeal virus]|uniref:Uncharacterized protein n=1 Tax=uncultured archaeal virus TaxID=1960247 RepID=A0A1S5Y337_9VIRU|nr:hypothetical protein JDFR1000234_51 [uncultured archaeal virus]
MRVVALTLAQYEKEKIKKKDIVLHLAYPSLSQNDFGISTTLASLFALYKDELKKLSWSDSIRVYLQILSSIGEVMNAFYKIGKKARKYKFDIYIVYYYTDLFWIRRVFVRLIEAFIKPVTREMEKNYYLEFATYFIKDIEKFLYTPPYETYLEREITIDEDKCLVKIIKRRDYVLFIVLYDNKKKIIVFAADGKEIYYLYSDEPPLSASTRLLDFLFTILE